MPEDAQQQDSEPEEVEETLLEPQTKARKMDQAAIERIINAAAARTSEACRDAVAEELGPLRESMSGLSTSFTVHKAEVQQQFKSLNEKVGTMEERLQALEANRSNASSAGSGGGGGGGGGSNTSADYTPQIPTYIDIKGFYDFDLRTGGLEDMEAETWIKAYFDALDKTEASNTLKASFNREKTLRSHRGNVVTKKIVLFIDVTSRSEAAACLTAVREYLAKTTVNGKECFATLEPPRFKKLLNSKIGKALNVLKKNSPQPNLYKPEWSTGMIYHKPADGGRAKLICQSRPDGWSVMSTNFLEVVNDGFMEADFIAATN